jgi:hypothetical protein
MFNNHTVEKKVLQFYEFSFKDQLNKRLNAFKNQVTPLS